MFKSKFPKSGFPRLLTGVVAAIAFIHAGVVFSAPGAHGPNGEHLDMGNQVQHSENPKFENFTEAFEILGEVLPEKVHLYLHDFSTNRPVADATIELESGDLSTEALYDESLKYYLIQDAAFVSKLNQPGEHEIVITILTETSGDLLAASLLTPQHKSEPEHEEEHHHEFDWTSALVGTAMLMAGVAVGRFTKGKKA